MTKLFAIVIAGVFSLLLQLSAQAADAAPAAATAAAKPASCDEQAVSKAGKPLTGAAKKAFLKKCEGGAMPAASSACADKAISKSGKPLHGAAKTAFIKKCEATAK